MMNEFYALREKSCAGRLFCSSFSMLVVLLFLEVAASAQMKRSMPAAKIREVNAAEIQSGAKTIAIVGVNIIDGHGGVPIADGSVIVSGTRIVRVGARQSITIPNDAEIVDGKGMSLLPGFIDSHFHLDNNKGLPATYLQHGITSVRDPGAWIEAYTDEWRPGTKAPRLFLCGPHLDMYPPAYPKDAYVVRDSLEAVTAVNRQIDAGASAIKVYFRLSPGLIKVICEAAHKRGIPVTAHLEITEALEAINCGLDGLEHVTSFGLSLESKRDGEKYRQQVLADNNARKGGRYEVWASIDVNSSKADSVCKYVAKKGIFISPTLGAFEYQPTADKTDTVRMKGFKNMEAFTARLRKAGARIVLGSHSDIEYATLGWAFQHEMELLVESGLTNSEVITAATLENAKNFRIDDRLGSIDVGKTADLLLVNGNPLQKISDARNVVAVMINGVWVKGK